ncbi:somatoliberin isoform X1 [Xiphias gladius]|uniref:somatoliberin isoform X1 n=1 Tax=Xiphias gladius TaxID=8245 RepID=UPI001A9983EF|nr:somatoliberin isoform X1 [Xiphias gladius]XP_040015639.1 somatoliberin isoform X1 [Xiphias gladius]XP_040015640.1 somatoliberin isoform X1 [Xiphias gladius]XP_040015641.1 somatoliberin isoform X1 [Xiphias gladius]XP_040015642.1 somatoliberin isoform X1 [Xiphias gladius]XP_040015643.1 somatoliberin isoform X1 [Xiphias gladius]
MEKAALLLFCCLVMSLSGSPLYPSIRFGQRDTSILMTSSINNPAENLRDDTSPPGERAEFRTAAETSASATTIRYSSGRHADAIFTNSYRKVLGQISARKFLQTIMGKRLSDESGSYVKRQSGVCEGSRKEDLTSIQSKQRYRGVHGKGMGPRLLS